MLSRWIDTPVAAGRTVRELALISVAALLLVSTLATPRPYWLNAGLYALALVCAWTRFFASRGLGMGIAISATVQWWSRMQYPHYSAGMLPAVAYAAPLLALVLASRDLEQRYELSPSSIPWLPNPWVHLPSWDLRLLRWSAYALGTQAGALSLAHMRTTHDLDGWPMIVTGLNAIVLLLLALGRPVALFTAAPLGAFILVKTVPLLGPSTAALQEGLAMEPGWFARSPELVLPCVVTAAISWVICTAYAVLLVDRTLRSRRRVSAAVGGAGTSSAGVRAP